MRRLAMVIELQGHADDIVAAVLQQGRDDARVDAARHGDHDARVGWSLASDQGSWSRGREVILGQTITRTRAGRATSLVKTI